MFDDKRRCDEWHTIASIAKRLGWFHAQMVPDPARPPAAGDEAIPLRIEITIDGRGVAAAGSDGDHLEIAQSHHLLIEFSADFPQQPPQVQVVSPVFHPNVAANGQIHLPDIGLHWQPALTLDVICERLWDVIRGAYVDLDSKVNVGAAAWFAKHTDATSLPVDPRRLSDGAMRLQNIVRYHRKGTPRKESPHRELVVIDDEPSGTGVPPSRPAGVDSDADSSPGIHFIR